MFIVIGVMFAGVAVGYLLRSYSPLRWVGRTVSYTILLLLFLLGLSVGSNPTIMDNLPTLGGQALVLATGGTLGSLILAWVVYRFFYKGGQKG